jgi:N-acetyl-anhydromuramyl-L-alanine amidase AmpD
MSEFLAKLWAWLVDFFKPSAPVLPSPTPQPTSPPVPAILKKGDEGQAVTNMQTKLVALGYKVEIDGIFGDESEVALKAFQKDNHIGRTGALGPQTYAALMSAKPMPMPLPNSIIVPDVTLVSPNYSNFREHAVDRIILHNTEGTVASAVGRFMNASEQVSAHYIIGRDGKITKMVQEGYTAWHSGDRSVNHRSIGIEIEAGGGTGTGMTPSQEICVINAVRLLQKNYQISRAGVLPHRDIVATNCPGSIWPTDANFEAWKTAHLYV